MPEENAEEGLEESPGKSLEELLEDARFEEGRALERATW